MLLLLHRVKHIPRPAAGREHLRHQLPLLLCRLLLPPLAPTRSFPSSLPGLLSFLLHAASCRSAPHMAATSPQSAARAALCSAPPATRQCWPVELRLVRHGDMWCRHSSLPPPYWSTSTSPHDHCWRSHCCAYHRRRITGRSWYPILGPPRRRRRLVVSVQQPSAPPRSSTPSASRPREASSSCCATRMLHPTAASLERSYERRLRRTSYRR